MEIAALVSGGVDSSVSVYCLRESGYTPTLFYIEIGNEGFGECPVEEDKEIARYIARHYGCRMEVVSLHTEYWDKVIGYAIAAARRGLTPNPDIMCNRFIKFGYFEERWGYEFARTATGHYATTTELEGRTWLSTARDALKDQTDFLAQITPLQVSKLLFPIGHLMKSEVRALAIAERLPSAYRRDSQGICFLGKISYNDFLLRYLGERVGKIIELESGRVMGEHRGYWFHTIGQRKGLGLSGGPWYVVGKSMEENLIYVSRGYDVETQYGKSLDIDSLHFLTHDPWGVFSGTREIAFKIRHTPEFTRGILSRSVSGGYHIESESKLQGIAAGQFAVIYDASCRLCIGSGTII